MTKETDYNNLTRLTDTEILDLYDTARANMSYYNAAEGANWYQEAEARGNCAEKLSIVRQELTNRKLEGRPGTYLC